MIVGKYHVVGVLGKGSFGKVFLARYDNQLYAIKTISKARLSQQSYLIPYLQGEIECMKSIKSDYVMNLIQVIQDQNNQYIVCQYCNGGNLSQYQKKATDQIIPLDKALQIVSYILKGLQQLHSKDYLHRDLKPQNILVKIQNKIETFKVADFGFAAKQKDHTGDIIGTAKFMAPEIYDDENYGYGVDMWAIGVILFFMLNNEYPFNPTPNNQIKDIKSKCPFSYEANVKNTNRKLLQNCNPKTEELFRRIFQFNPTKRMTFHEIKQFSLFRKYFKSDTKAFTSSIILYSKEYNIKEHIGKVIPSKVIASKVIGSKVIDSKVIDYKENNKFKEEIKQLQFPIHHKQFLFELSEYFKNESIYLSTPLKMALSYNLLKLYLIQTRKLQQILNKKKLPEQVPKNLNWEKFFESKQYETLLTELNNQLKGRQAIFQNSFNDCFNHLPKIQQIIKGFGQSLRIDINEKCFDDFKTAFRTSTNYANRILNQIQNKQTHQMKDGSKLTDLRIRVFICHMINRVFIKSELIQNFSYYFEWKKTAKEAKQEDKDIFNFKSFKIWMSQQQKGNLVKTINVIFKKYFG